MYSSKNYFNYKHIDNSWKNIYKNMNNSKEQFFVSYAVRGPMVVPSYGLELDLPVNHPISGPVREPSPLNTRWKYDPGFSGLGVL